MRKRPIDLPGFFAAHLCIKIYQRKIRNAMNDDIRNRKSIIGIKDDDADVPANGRCRDDDVFADIRETLRKIKINRLSKICGESKQIYREEDLFDKRGQGGKIILDEPREISRKRRHPKHERINGRKINGRRIDPPRDPIGFAELSPIKRDPAVLLPNEMKNRDER